ncbi:MAG: SIS domain-containing protein [bacterium]
MTDSSWLEEYFRPYRSFLEDTEVFLQLVQARDLILSVKSRGAKLMLAGNGASASIASHLAVDFTKQAGVVAMSFNEPNLITAYSNDYGYDRWLVQALRHYAQPGDAVVLISSSGKSPNIVQAAEYARDAGLSMITLSGFASDNPLRSIGDVNLWVESRAYNHVECIHMIWLTAICDLIIGKAEYPVNG